MTKTTAGPAWLGALIMPVCLLILMGVGALCYMVLWDSVSPLVSQKLVNMEIAQDDTEGHIVVTRHFCFKNPSEAQAIRIFRRLPDTGQQVDEVFETNPIHVHLDGGCYVRARRVEMPEGVGVGRYSYQTGLRWCNSIGKCRTVWLPAAIVALRQVNGRKELTLEQAEVP